MPGWLKAGLIGALILVVLQLLGLSPYLVCVTLPLILVAYIVTGILAASYLKPARSAGSGAGQGALAALVAAVIGGIVGLVIPVVQALTGGTARFLTQMPPGFLEQLRQAGIPPRFVLGPVGAAVGGTICCGVGIVLAVVLGAASGALYAAVKPQ